MTKARGWRVGARVWLAEKWVEVWAGVVGEDWAASLSSQDTGH